MKSMRLLYCVLTMLFLAWAALSPELQAQEPTSAGNSGGKVMGSFYPGRFVPISRLGASLAAQGTTATDKTSSAKVDANAQQSTVKADSSSQTTSEGAMQGTTKGGTPVQVTRNDAGQATISELQNGQWVNITDPKTGIATTSKGEQLKAVDNQTGGLSLYEKQNYKAEYYPDGKIKSESFDWVEISLEKDSNTQLKTTATYDPAKGTITYKDASGKERTVKIADLGLSAEWMSALTKGDIELSAELNSDGSIKLLVGKERGYAGNGWYHEGAKKWEYDPSSHLVAHYTGEAGKEKCTMVTSDQKYTCDYIWGSPDAKDPGAGPDGHFVVQRFNYDEKGSLKTIDYFTWTAGDRQGQEKARYMYRQDTVQQAATGSGSSNCPENITTTKYFNDPFPVDWDPVLTGTVTKDKNGNYWLHTQDGKDYLLTARIDGFDADKDGKSGADEMNSMKWESLVGKEITVRGHQVNEDSEGGIYKDGKKAEVFEVCDIITKDGSGGCGGEFETLLKNLQSVADTVDPINSGLVGNKTGGTLGFVNLFNGRIPTPSELFDKDQEKRLMNGLAPYYLDNIPKEIRGFTTPDMEAALRALEEDKPNQQTDSQQDTKRQDPPNTQLRVNSETKTTVDDLLKKSKLWLELQ